MIERCNMGEESEVAAMLGRLRKQHGPLCVVVHTAGVLADALLVNQDAQTMHRVFSAKADGAWYLHKHTSRDRLQAFALYSSPAALFGNRSGSNYAGANSYLDALARWRSCVGLVASSHHWTYVEDVGMVAALETDSNSQIPKAFRTPSKVLQETIIHSMGRGGQARSVQGLYPQDFLELMTMIPSVKPWLSWLGDASLATGMFRQVLPRSEVKVLVRLFVLLSSTNHDQDVTEIASELRSLDPHIEVFKLWCTSETQGAHTMLDEICLYAGSECGRGQTDTSIMLY